MEAQRKRIAIACQGGGSHTAFTAGVLQRLLRDNHNIVALSGTSGGAICALLAWYGLLLNDRSRASELLEAFWQDNSAESVWEQFGNYFVVGNARLRGRVALPELSPYVLPDWGRKQLRVLLERYVEFDRIQALFGPQSPKLYVGAVDILSGSFRVFRDTEMSPEAILASAAIPTLFRAMHIDKGIYWDGLFSQNPPVRDLTGTKPDEIWVIQINPRARAEEPRTLEAIQDRRNELSGNISLEQELFFIEKINELLRTGLLTEERYRPITIRRIDLRRELDYASKLDRSPAFIRDLMVHGRDEADGFLRQLT